MLSLLLIEIETHSMIQGVAMPTDLHVVFRRKGLEQAETESSIVIASIWLAFYLLIAGATVASPSLSSAVELAARY